MASEFKLPEIGEGVFEGEIVKWHVNVGDTVAVDQELISVLTDKATVEITADFNGVIQSLSGESGDFIEVGAVLVTYTASGQSKDQPAPDVAAGADTPKQEPASADSAVVDFHLPEIGEGVFEGEMVEWLVAEGDQVAQDQPIAGILTDKATVEITAPFDGKVVKFMVAAADIVEVGADLCQISTTDKKAGADKVVVSKAVSTAEPVAVADSAGPRSAVGNVSPENNPSISVFGTPLATPAVRRFAAKNGVDLRTVRGTGPNNRITRANVEAIVAASENVAVQPASPAPAAPAPVAVAPPASVAPQGGDRREKIRGLRKAIYNSMSRSKRTIPHFTYLDEVEMDQLVAVRKALKSDAKDLGANLTFLPFFVKAVVLALKKFPIVNASVDDESMEIVYKNRYNIGIATATAKGLTVPVLKNADQKSILEIAQEMGGLIDRARNQRSTREDISDGTFTITSLGRLGGLLATPIINHPEVAIMGIHNMEDRAVVRSGEIVIRKMMNFSVAFDHRVVDGDVGAVFAQEVKGYLESPSRLMLHLT